LRCFPHIVNLACKAVLGVLTNPKYIDDMQQDYEDYNPSGGIDRDIIATVRGLVSSVGLKLILKSLY
jgi:hypothetical protein